MKKFIVHIIAFIFLFLAMNECFFRWGIPAPDLPQKVQNTQFDIFKFTHHSQKGLFTFGRTAQIRGSFFLNNQGYISSLNYTENQNSTALIGDSYVSSLYTDIYDNIDQHLMRLTFDNTNVYNFGMSGANLAEYIKYMDYAASSFGCRKFIVLISNGDLLESYMPLSVRKYERQIWLDEDSIRTANSKPFRKGFLGKYLYKSALFRYAVTNLSFSGGKQEKSINLNSYADELQKVADYLIEEIDNKYEVLFLLQGQKTYIYDDSTRSLENQILINSLKKFESDFIDLNPLFKAEYQKRNKKFEFDINDHWNAYSNKLVARYIHKHWENLQQNKHAKK